MKIRFQPESLLIKLIRYKDKKISEKSIFSLEVIIKSRFGSTTLSNKKNAFPVTSLLNLKRQQLFSELQLRDFLLIQILLKLYKQLTNICDVPQNIFGIFKRLIFVDEQDG